LAEKRNDKVWEVADLLYFINAYMAQENIEWNEVLNELQRKRRLK
jgi:phosphoribosyl-ATP pyrophosphohydrolase